MADRRVVPVGVLVHVEAPERWDDLAAHLAFTLGGDLIDSNAGPRNGSAIAAAFGASMDGRTHFSMRLAVPDVWTDAVTDEFEARFARAVRYARGMHWLRADEVLALLAAEDVAAKLVPGTADLFEAMKATRPSGWPPLVEALLVKAGDAGLAASTTAVVEAAFKSLLGG